MNLKTFIKRHPKPTADDFVKAVAIYGPEAVAAEARRTLETQAAYTFGYRPGRF